MDNRTSRFSVVSLLAAGAAFTMATPAAQALSLVTSTSGDAVLNSFDWSSLGPVGTAPTNPFTINATLATLSASVQQPTNKTTTARQSSTWEGNFAAGDYLLTTQGNNGPMTFTFNRPVAGAGTQIQAAIPGFFQAKIEAFTAAGLSLGSYTIDGFSDDFADNSAIYIGVRDTTNTISTLVLSVPLAGSSSQDANDFAINTLQILAPTTQMVPSPLPLLGAGAAFGWSRQLRRRLKRQN